MPSRAENVITQARQQGSFRQVLDQLIELASSDDPTVAWQAAAGAIPILFWHDEFGRAANLAEDIVAGQGPVGGALCDQDFPFDAALLAGHLHAGSSPSSQLSRLADLLPPGRVLTERFQWLAEQAQHRALDELLPGYEPWGEEAKPLDSVIGGQLVSRDYTSLSASQQRVVWQALSVANDFQRARELTEATGQTPPQFAVCTWMAGWYATVGEAGTGETLLLEAHPRWQPYAPWDPLPDYVVVQPRLRSIVTERVREFYLSQPIGRERSST